ncbi:MAG TPA: EpsG family protein [Caulobacteraceae bacterium]
MWIYWALFCVPAVASFSPWRLAPRSRLFMVAIAALTLILIIGLRDHIGIDWANYEDKFHDYQVQSLFQILLGPEPGFGLINWISAQFGWGVYGVNFFSAVILITGLTFFLIRQPNIWRCLALAAPILLVQMGMNLIRQACAIGFICLALNAFVDRRLYRYILFSVLAFTFHQTAIVFVPLAIMIRHSRTLIFPIIVPLAGVVLVIFLFRGVEFYRDTYILQDLGGAAGGFPRIALNLIALAVFAAFRNYWAKEYGEYRIFAILSIIILSVTPLFVFAQVAVDRLEYYFIPVQIAVISRTAGVLPPRIAVPFKLVMFAIYAAVMGAWFHFSWIAQLNWLPYRSLVF